MTFNRVFAPAHTTVNAVPACLDAARDTAMAGSTALGGPEVPTSDHDGVTHQRRGGRFIPAGLELAFDLPAAVRLLSTLAPPNGAAATAVGAPDDVTTTLTDVA